MTEWNLLAECGQLVGVGFDGPRAPPGLLRRIADGRLGWVILFSRNVETPAQLATLCGELQRAAPPGRPLGIAVDQEGGRVQRLRSPWPRWPPAATLGALADPERVRQVGQAVGEALRSAGIHLNLAPVLDVHTNPDNPVIGDRAFGTTVDAVVRAAAAYAEGLAAAGVAACGKHFPGHGDTHLDSHTHLPVVSHPPSRLQAVELAPFAALSARLPAIMSAHVVFPAWDPDHPATLSEPVIKALLRDELGFGAVVFSDDLEMKAVADRYSPEALAEAAVRAGVDVVCHCHDVARQERTLSALVQRADAEPDFAARVRRAAQRVAALKARWVADRPPPDPDAAERVARDPRHHRLAADLSAP
jgi:beta-N-acetylhexosaminidase